MAKENITRMTCDRCGKVLILNNGALDYEEGLRNAAKWETLRLTHMGGEMEWLFCPECFNAFLTRFLKGSLVEPLPVDKS
jgi:predicted RNA-binding Zn-ribbon protein involved in translation (DUF1610 family)